MKPRRGHTLSNFAQRARRVCVMFLRGRTQVLRALRDVNLRALLVSGNASCTSSKTPERSASCGLRGTEDGQEVPRKKRFMTHDRFTLRHLRAGENLRAGARKVLSHHPVGTSFGSTVGAALVTVAAGSAGAGSVVVCTCLATGAVIGGWAGHAISKRRSKRTDAGVLRRQAHTIRLLRVTRMLRRRNVQ